MDNVSANPIFVVLFFVLRCIIPLVLMLGVSALLRKLGLIAPPPQEPEDPTPQNLPKAKTKA